MSRKVKWDPNADLSDDDLLYLLERGRIPQPEASEVRERLSVYSDPIEEGGGPGNTGTVRRISTEELKAELARRGEVEENPNTGLKGSTSFADEDEEEDYEEGWNNDSRRAELARRGLSTEGNKEELIQRLLEDDASDDEED